MRVVALALAVALAACGRTYLDTTKPDAAEPPDACAPDAAAPPSPATTTLAPPPGPFNGQVEVSFTTDKPATIIYTADGSDPRTSPTVQSKDAPFTLTLEATTTIGFFSRTPEGAEEDERSVSYVRAGGPTGTVSGVVVIGDSVVGQSVGVAADMIPTILGTATQTGEMPFLVQGLATGSHQLVPFADTNGDGLYIPFIDTAGATYSFDLDLTDPFKSSLEGVKLYLGASAPGTCTLKGHVTFTAPVPNQTLAVAALDPSAMQSGVDPRTLLTSFSQGYRVTTDAQTTDYPYEILNLAPGQYLPVPALTGLSGGIELNLLADLNGTVTCTAGAVITVPNFEFGQVALVGTLEYTPASPAAFVYGAVVARSITMGGGIKAQIILMPAYAISNGTALQGSFGAQALRDDQDFDLRAFTNLDTTAGTDPFTAAFTWATNPFSTELPQATVTATAPSVTVDLKAP